MLTSMCVFIYNRAWLGYSVHEAQITVYFARFARTLVYAYSALEAQSIRCSVMRTSRHVMCTVHMKPKAYLGL